MKTIVIESGLLGQRQQEKPKSSPWGQVDQCEEIIPGMWSVSTPSHGGIKLSPERAAKVPRYFKTWLGGFTWYEEDCDYAIVFLVFEQELRQSESEWVHRVLDRGGYKKTVESYHTEAWKKWQDQHAQVEMF